MTIAVRVERILCQTLPRAASVEPPLFQSTRLVDDLGADWNDYNTIAAELQKEFRVDVPVRTLESWSRVGEIVLYVKRWSTIL